MTVNPSNLFFNSLQDSPPSTPSPKKPSKLSFSPSPSEKTAASAERALDRRDVKPIPFSPKERRFSPQSPSSQFPKLSFPDSPRPSSPPSFLPASPLSPASSFSQKPHNTSWTPSQSQAPALDQSATQQPLSSSSSDRSFIKPRSRPPFSNQSSQDLSPVRKYRDRSPERQYSVYAPSFSSQSTPASCPRAPKKTPKPKSASSPLELIKQQMPDLQFQGIAFDVISRSKGRGCSFQTYDVASKERLHPEYKNDDLMAKIPLPELSLRGPKFITREIRAYIEHYNKLLEKNFPIVPILNAKTAISDGFILTVKVPKKFEISWGPETFRESLSEATQKHLEELKEMFQKAYDANKEDLSISPDLQLSNLHIGSDGTLVLIDPGANDTDTPLSVIWNKLMRTITNGNNEIEEYLKPNGFRHPDASRKSPAAAVNYAAAGIRGPFGGNHFSSSSFISSFPSDAIRSDVSGMSDVSRMSDDTEENLGNFQSFKNFEGTRKNSSIYLSDDEGEEKDISMEDAN